MAAIEETGVAGPARQHERASPRPLGLLAAAALALPGVMPLPAHAEEAPERAAVALKYLQYSDSQAVRTRYPYYSGSEGGRFQRVEVQAPSVQLLLPLGRRWLIEASGTVDDVSGASPRYYSDVSGASRMSDRRTAGDARVTRYFDRTVLALGVAGSSENDYRSQALSAELRRSSADNNTTFSVAVGGSQDRIEPTEGGTRGVTEESRRTAELMLSVTAALTRNDLVQLSLGYSQGRGFFSDPYKQFDQRPRERDIATYLVRWNHHLENWGLTLRSQYRYYADTFDIRAHSAELQVVWPVSTAWKLTPSVRYHTQSSASFYVDPITDLAVYPGTLGPTLYSSMDHRLSAFGAVTVGLKTELELGDWTFDLKLERYEQRANWRRGGPGSPAIDDFRAQSVQVGLAHRF